MLNNTVLLGLLASASAALELKAAEDASSALELIAVDDSSALELKPAVIREDEPDHYWPEDGEPCKAGY